MQLRLENGDFKRYPYLLVRAFDERRERASERWSKHAQSRVSRVASSESTRRDVIADACRLPCRVGGTSDARSSAFRYPTLYVRSICINRYTFTCLYNKVISYLNYRSKKQFMEDCASDRSRALFFSRCRSKEGSFSNKSESYSPFIHHRNISL